MPITSEILNKHKKNIVAFVETGTFKGDGVVAALDSGFQEIYSIEAYENRYEDCCHRFENFDNVSLIFGDSSKDLMLILKELKSRALFWLDAHYYSKNVERQCPVLLADAQPIISELRQINIHFIKNHTILIDDRRLFKGNSPNWNNILEKEIIEELIKINPNYSIKFVDSSFCESDIIVAEIL